MRIPLLLVPLETSKKVMHHFVGLFEKILIVHPGIKYDLVEANILMSPAEYLAATALSAFIWSILMFSILFSVFLSGGMSLQESLFRSVSGLFIGIVLYLYYIFYPKILAGKLSQEVDKDLVFALKDLLLQTSVGIPLYTAMINISKAGYGLVSEEFGETVREIRVGIPIEDALQRMAVRTRSEYMKKAIWQIINGWRAGATLKGILRSLVDDLTANKRNLIRSYGQELNLWILVYMLFAVVAPTIGATLLVVLSAMAGGGVSMMSFIMLISASFIVQVILIGFVKSRRPLVAL